MSVITEEALEFAKQHIRAFYASDFFPDADEYEAVWERWDEVLSYYDGVDELTLGTTPEDMACAKATGGYRLVHQLQPLDAIAYTALIWTIAPYLEAKRIPEAERSLVHTESIWMKKDDYSKRTLVVTQPIGIARRI